MPQDILKPKRLQDMIAANDILNEGVASSQAKGERVPERILKKAILDAIMIEYYSLALEDVDAVLKAARNNCRMPTNLLDAKSLRQELIDALADLEVN